MPFLTAGCPHYSWPTCYTVVTAVPAASPYRLCEVTLVISNSQIWTHQATERPTVPGLGLEDSPGKDHATAYLWPERKFLRVSGHTCSAGLAES